MSMPFRVNPVGTLLFDAYYKRIPYIQAEQTDTGTNKVATNFIDTGVVPNEMTVMQLDIEALPTQDAYAENGALTNVGTCRFGIGIWQSTIGISFFCSWGPNILTPLNPIPSTSRATVELGPKYFKINGENVSVSKPFNWGTEAIRFTIRLFGRNAGGRSAYAPCRQKLYRAKIGTQNSDGSVTWVRDLVPVRKIETGELMMLDICDPNNLTEYPNAGTGSFTTEE